jgi:putative monooxygenase
LVLQPGGYVPIEPIHLNRDEIIRVEQGELRVLLDGREIAVAAGSALVIPSGTRRSARNNGPETLRCVLEYRPGLDLDRLFQCLGV